MEKFYFDLPELSESDKQYMQQIGWTPEQVHEYRLGLALKYAESGTITRGIDPQDWGLPSIYIDELKKQGIEINEVQKVEPEKKSIPEEEIKKLIDAQFENINVDNINYYNRSFDGKQFESYSIPLTQELAQVLDFDIQSGDQGPYTGTISYDPTISSHTNILLHRFNCMGNSRGSKLVEGYEHDEFGIMVRSLLQEKFDKIREEHLKKLSQEQVREDVKVDEVKNISDSLSQESGENVGGEQVEQQGKAEYKVTVKDLAIASKDRVGARIIRKVKEIFSRIRNHNNDIGGR